MASAPSLEGKDQHFGSDKVLSVAAWLDGDAASVAEFAENNNLTFPNIAADLTPRFERDGGIPSFLLIAPGHELVMVDQGHPTEEQIQAVVDEYFP